MGAFYCYVIWPFRNIYFIGAFLACILAKLIDKKFILGKIMKTKWLTAVLVSAIFTANLSAEALTETDKVAADYVQLALALGQHDKSYVDAYYEFEDYPRIAEACDVILANCYPFWEGCDIENASAYLDHMYQVTKNVANSKPVIVAETGWPSAGESTESAEPSEENAIRYLINANQWAKANNADLFYFSAFDETWKVQEEGPVGGNWGIWNINEQLKYT